MSATAADKAYEKLCLDVFSDVHHLKRGVIPFSIIVNQQHIQISSGLRSCYSHPSSPSGAKLDLTAWEICAHSQATVTAALPLLEICYEDL